MGVKVVEIHGELVVTLGLGLHNQLVPLHHDLALLEKQSSVARGEP